MRIIAGSAKGRKLLSPHNQGRITEKGDINATRPTLDRVKESMFSIISGKILDARVLDMFSGTGSPWTRKHKQRCRKCRNGRKIEGNSMIYSQKTWKIWGFRENQPPSSQIHMNIAKKQGIRAMFLI